MSWFGGDKRKRLSISERLFNRFVYKYYGKNLLVDLQLEAKRETVAYIKANMADAQMLRDRWDLLEFAVGEAKLKGLCLEFGVEKGASLRAIAGLVPGAVHGFDSFEGLPEAWGGTFERKGKFSQHGNLPSVPENVQLHVGWFDQTLPAFLAGLEQAGGAPQPVAFLHVDCDIYSSTRIVLAGLAERIIPGTVIVFDEYFNYPNWQRHEYRAFQEFVAARGLRYGYLGFSVKNGHVAVRIEPAR